MGEIPLKMDSWKDDRIGSSERGENPKVYEKIFGRNTEFIYNG